MLAKFCPSLYILHTEQCTVLSYSVDYLTEALSPLYKDVSYFMMCCSFS